MIAAALASSLCVPLWASHEEEPCALRVEIHDAQGRAVSGAAVSWVEEGWRRVTGADGVACFTRVPEQAARLVVTARDFAVAARDVTAGERRILVELREPFGEAFGDTVVVSATGTARRLVEVPVHIQQIDRSDMRALAARTLAEAVEYTAGLRVESNCQNCNTSQLRMLGLEGPYSQIVVDGQPTVSSLAMVYGLEQIPQRLLDGIEVMKGGGSSIYGANAVGGTVNLLPHQPDHTHVEVDASLTGYAGASGQEAGRGMTALADWGTEDRSRGLTLYGQADRVPSVDVDGDGYSEVTHRELEAGGVRGQTFLFGQSAQLSGDLNLTHGFRRGGDLLRFHLQPHETAVTEQIETTRTAASLRFLHTATPKFDYRLAASWARTEWDSYYGAGFDENAYGTTHNPTRVADSQFNHYLGNGTLTWGLQWSEDEISDHQLGFDRVIEETNQSFGLFVQDDRKLASGVTVLWGARVDDHSALERAIVSPRGAVLWSPRSNLTLRASVATGFRPPVTFDEDLHIELVGGGLARVSQNAPDLREESSRSYLLSAEWRPTFPGLVVGGSGGAAAFEVAVFRTDLDDLFFHLEDDNPHTPFLEVINTNLGSARVEGVELSGGLRFGSALSFDFGWVEQSARFDRPEPDFGGRDFYRTPKRYGNASARVELPHEIELFAGLIYTGEMDAPHYAGFVAEDRLERTADFLTVDLNLRRSFPLARRPRTRARARCAQPHQPVSAGS